MKKFEALFATLFLGGIFLEIFEWKTAIIPFCASIVLALFYQFLGVFYFNGIALRDIFNKSAYAQTSVLRLLGTFLLAGGSMGVLVFSAVYFLFRYIGGQEIFLIGAFSGLVTLIVSFVRYQKKKDLFYVRIGVRIVLLIVLNVVLLLVVPQR
ncbi:hypothetical protein SAMN04488109_5846 [Chryseolinea serpens]|uniref:Uncharacterized protein n=1 Tax=Chryseolinea serpens TaxID=947013 RepID=A0A1M5WPB6_9BACT|nr:hypothetical protein [Chryseolinea serpens]SHH88853.1 hypothetical protein SAMN04488109_5846 [Chryseolinea serpens]